MGQLVTTPTTMKCAKCGALAHVIDWNYNMRYRVVCDKNHTATGKFNTVHIALCKWNNAQDKLTKLV